MKLENKVTVRVEMDDLHTQKKLKQQFSNVKAGQPDASILELGEIVASLTKGDAVLGGIFEVVEYRITAGN